MVVAVSRAEVRARMFWKGMGRMNKWMVIALGTAVLIATGTTHAGMMDDPCAGPASDSLSSDEMEDVDRLADDRLSVTSDTSRRWVPRITYAAAETGESLELAARPIDVAALPVDRVMRLP